MHIMKKTKISFRKSDQGSLFEEGIFKLRPEGRKESTMQSLEEKVACVEIL